MTDEIHYVQEDPDVQAVHDSAYRAGMEEGTQRGIVLGTFGTLLVLVLLYLVFAA